MNAQPQYAVECEALGRVYRFSRGLGRGGAQETVALDDLNLTITPGSVFGLLGPNGAGKTTTVRILATLLTPTSGTARVLGHDVVEAPARVRERIGLILGGDRGLYTRLSGRQNLSYHAALNHMDRKRARERREELLGLVGLSNAADTAVERYSRGMKQRLHIARGLLTEPDVVFMDEPTIGLDPVGAQEVRAMIPELAAAGHTILLTTHYMFEADQLCDEVAIINEGKLVARDTPAAVRRRFATFRVVELASASRTSHWPIACRRCRVSSTCGSGRMERSRPSRSASRPTPTCAAPSRRPWGRTTSRACCSATPPSRRPTWRC